MAIGIWNWGFGIGDCVLGIRIGDWDGGLGFEIGIGYFGLGIGEWDWGLGLGIWDFEMRIWNWGLGLGIWIWYWELFYSFYYAYLDVVWLLD